MSIVKQSLNIPQQQFCENKKLDHVYHIISRVYSEMRECECAPIISKEITKYDLIAKNIDEAILLIAYREKQHERFDKNIKKIRKLIQKI